MNIVEYLGHEVFHPVAVLFFSRTVFGLLRVLSCVVEERQEKKWCTPSIVLRDEREDE